MKRLKYLTHDPAAVKNAIRALAQKGFDVNRLKVVSRDNSRHHYDRLITASENDAQARAFSFSILFYVCFFMFGSLAISLSFIDFPALVLLIFASVFIIKILHSAGLLLFSGVKPSREVYFLVVDVDKQSEGMVSKVTSAEPRLFSQ